MQAHSRVSAFTCLWLLASAAPTLALQPAAPTVAGVAKTTRPAVVTIKTPTGTGSGVIVDPAGVIVTNLHVVQGDRAATIVLENGDSYDDVSVVDVDARRDIVLLKIKAFGLTAAKIGNSDRIRIGDRVVLVSSPRGLELTVSDGVISAQRDSGEGFRMLQTTAAASPGSSGGGLFNMTGELIGIMSSKRLDGENLNFALPFNYVRGLIATTTQMTLSDLAAKFPATGSAPAAGTSTGTAPQDTARMARLIEQSGETFVKDGDAQWVADYEGDFTKSIKVFVTLSGNMVILTSVVDTKAPTNVATMVELMRLNYDADFAKLGLHKNQSLLALTEADFAPLDGPTLKRLVRGVATLTDKAVGVLVAAPDAKVLSYNDGRVTLDYGHTSWQPPAKEEGYHLEDPKAEAFVKLVVERAEIPTDRLVEVALDNARKTDPKLRVVRRSTRTVNGVRMAVVEFELVSSGVPITFVGHYYGGPEGAVQILGWSSRNQARDYRAQFDLLIEGFRLVK